LAKLNDFWNNRLTYGTSDTFGAKPIKGEGMIVKLVD
jgi:hypothetical protein